MHMCIHGKMLKNPKILIKILIFTMKMHVNIDYSSTTVYRI